jgi:hypothetical protein
MTRSALLTRQLKSWSHCCVSGCAELTANSIRGVNAIETELSYFAGHWKHKL